MLGSSFHSSHLRVVVVTLLWVCGAACTRSVALNPAEYNQLSSKHTQLLSVLTTDGDKYLAERVDVVDSTLVIVELAHADVHRGSVDLPIAIPLNQLARISKLETKEGASLAVMSSVAIVAVVAVVVTGARVRTLVDERRESNKYRVVWDGRDNHGNSVASGVYFYRLIAGDFRATKKMVLIR